MDPVDPAATLTLDAERLAPFPEGYRHLGYLQSTIGFDCERQSARVCAARSCRRCTRKARRGSRDRHARGTAVVVIARCEHAKCGSRRSFASARSLHFEFCIRVTDEHA